MATTHQLEQEAVLCLKRLELCSSFENAVPSDAHGTEAYNYHSVPYGTELPLPNGRKTTLLLVADMPGPQANKRELYDKAVSKKARHHLLRAFVQAALPGFVLRKHSSRLRGDHTVTPVGTWNAQVVREFLRDAGFRKLLQDPVMQQCLQDADDEIESMDTDDEEEEEEEPLSPLAVPETTADRALSLSQLEPQALPVQIVEQEQEEQEEQEQDDNIDVVSASPIVVEENKKQEEVFDPLAFLNISPPTLSQQQQTQPAGLLATMALTPFDLPSASAPPASQDSQQQESPPRDMRLGTFLPKDTSINNDDDNDEDELSTVFSALPLKEAPAPQPDLELEPELTTEPEPEPVLVHTVQPPQQQQQQNNNFSGPFVIFANDPAAGQQQQQQHYENPVHQNAALAAVAYILLSTYPPYVPLSAKGSFKKSDLYTLNKTTQQKHALPIANSIKNFIKNYKLDDEPFGNNEENGFVAQLTQLAHILCPRTSVADDTAVDYIIERLKTTLDTAEANDGKVVFKGLLNTTTPELSTDDKEQYLFIYRAEALYTLVSFSVKTRVLQVDHRVQKEDTQVIKHAIRQVLSLSIDDFEVRIDAVSDGGGGTVEAPSWLVALFGTLSYMFWSDLHWFTGNSTDGSSVASGGSSSGGGRRSRAAVVPNGCSVVSVEPQAYWDNSLLNIFPAVLFVWLMQDPQQDLKKQIKSFKRANLAVSSDDQKRAPRDPFHPSVLVVQQGDVFDKTDLEHGASHQWTDEDIVRHMQLQHQPISEPFPVFVARVPREPTYTELVRFVIPWIYRVGLMLHDEPQRSVVGFVSNNTNENDYDHPKSEIKYLLEFLALWKLARGTKYQKQRFTQLYSLVSRTFHT